MFEVINIGHEYMVGITQEGEDSPTMFGEKKLEELASDGNVYAQALEELNKERNNERETDTI